MTAHCHSAFTFIRQHPIDALGVNVEEYQHTATGATHYHLASDNKENVFLVGLRTVPMDHKGVAHILEHTALCGSEKYPVRDPFFMMIRRSLNTFMNAFTSNDWTAYPFASLNRKDYFNLLDVYLDAVFFSRLDELDFLQEGHRLEFTEPNNKNSDLSYKGVVFNEMKGAMSSVTSTLWQTLCKHLFPSSTYHYNSGGDPEYITDLSYAELQDFYKKHYHPSNAMFITFGDIPAAELQQQVEEKALSKFTQSDSCISVADEKRLQAPVYAQEYYAFDSEDDASQQSHFVVSWLLGKSTNLQDMIDAQMLSYILLENSASPLQHYLESSPLGSAPSPMSGLEDSYKELVFACGLAGCKADDAAQIEQDILDILENVSKNGIEASRLSAIVHQLELSQREISGDGYPYGLQIILNALTAITHRGDPISLLDLDPVLAKLQQDIKAPDYVSKLIERLLLNNMHRISLTLMPDTELSSRRIAQEKQQLATIKASLSDEQARHIIDQAEALAQRQAQEDDSSILPKVGLEDVPEKTSAAKGNSQHINNIRSSHYAQGTNGLAYQQLIFELPKLSDELIAQLPLYCQLLTEVGLDELSYTDVQNLQSETVGSISAYCSMRASLNSEQDSKAYLILSAKALVRNQQAMSELLKRTFTQAHFNELTRIKDIVSLNRSRKERSITGSGHALAMTAACATYSPIAKINERWGGISSIASIKALDDTLKNDTDNKQLQILSNQLSHIHELMQKMPMQVLNVSEQEHQQALNQSIEQLWGESSNGKNEAFTLEHIRQSQQVAWLCNTQVSFCAKAYPTVTANHKDGAALIVLGGFLRNGYLHTAIREKGGAYGAGASQDNNIAAFKFYSYRDPRITGTLNDFDKAIDWMLNQQHKPQQLEEAILGVISSLDKPSSPASEAKQAFYNELFDRSEEELQAYRERVLAVTIDDLIHVTNTYLKQGEASVAVVSSTHNEAELQELGLDIKQL